MYKIIFILALLFCGGCMSVKYNALTHDVTVQKFLWETKIGHLEFQSGTTKVIVENYSSESQAVQGLVEANKFLANMPK